ncbi:hypothetical protein ACFP65_06740 [Marinilactibacillus sp. GCM10026970]|uniref:hypothetical protein n=1 Tax=Marinilactibacillus sp. GCM10026970 TaxID=3252642 RepID=UPI003617D652
MKKQLTHFIRLVNFEFERMFKFLVGIMAIVVVSNLIGFIYVPLSYMSYARETMASQSLSIAQYLSTYSPFSLNTVLGSLWIYGPLALGIIGFMFFAIFTWYREWFGKNTFVHRLLMLPISRMYIYSAKVLTVFLGIFSLLTLQYIVIWIGQFISRSLISSEFYIRVSLANAFDSNQILQFLLPSSVELFFTFYLLGFLFILVLYTAILLERSYRIRGFLMGLVFGIFSLLLVVSPHLLPTILRNHYILFPSEQLLATLLLSIVVGIVSIGLSRYLLKHKITI